MGLVNSTWGTLFYKSKVPYLSLTMVIKQCPILCNLHNCKLRWYSCTLSVLHTLLCASIVNLNMCAAVLNMWQTWVMKGSGCGSVGRTVAFDTRGPQFNSSHRQNFIEHLFIINCIEKTKINKKRPGMAHFFKKTWVMTKLSSHWIRGLTLDDQLYF